MAVSYCLGYALGIHVSSLGKRRFLSQENMMHIGVIVLHAIRSLDSSSLKTISPTAFCDLLPSSSVIQLGKAWLR